jgi:hypothetical protein
MFRGIVKRIPVLVLVLLSFASPISIRAQTNRRAESAQRVQKAAKKNQKRAAKNQRKAAKKYRKAQRKAAKRQKRRG